MPWRHWRLGGDRIHLEAPPAPIVSSTCPHRFRSRVEITKRRPSRANRRTTALRTHRLTSAESTRVASLAVPSSKCRRSVRAAHRGGDADRSAGRARKAPPPRASPRQLAEDRTQRGALARTAFQREQAWSSTTTSAAKVTPKHCWHASRIRELRYNEIGSLLTHRVHSFGRRWS